MVVASDKNQADFGVQLIANLNTRSDDLDSFWAHWKKNASTDDGLRDLVYGEVRKRLELSRDTSQYERAMTGSLSYLELRTYDW